MPLTPINGADQRLRDLIAGLRDTPRGKHAIAAGAAETMPDLIHRQIERHAAPDGEQWAEPVKAGGSAADFESGMRVVVSPERITVTNSHPGAGYFQWGSKHQIDRAILPKGPLPRGWSVTMGKRGRERLAEVLGPDKAT